MSDYHEYVFSRTLRLALMGVDVALRDWIMMECHVSDYYHFQMLVCTISFTCVLDTYCIWHLEM